MDGDPTVEPLLDTFSLILPLPYRIAVILVLGMPDRILVQLISDKILGVWAWAVNLHYLSVLKIASSPII